jgi:hypothetical protein
LLNSVSGGLAFQRVALCGRIKNERAHVACTFWGFPI